MPGTDTNVTPDKDVPTIPIETIYQGDFLFPRKNASLLLLRPVIHAISSKTAEIGSDNKKDDIAVHVLLTSVFFCAKIRLYFEIPHMRGFYRDGFLEAL